LLCTHRTRQRKKTGDHSKRREVVMTMSTEAAAMFAMMQQQLADMSLRVLKKRAFVFVDRTASKPHSASETHSKSVLESTIVSLDEYPEKVWDARYIRPVEGNEVNVDSESMVVANVVLILEALFVGFGIKNDQVQISTQRIVAEWDIVLLFGPQRIPFAAIEVKSQGEKALTTKAFSKEKVHYPRPA
jgi:hypothetical protein